MIKIIGWTDIYHSFAMVNQWQMLAMDDLGAKLAFHEAPKFREFWSSSSSPAGFPVQLEHQLEKIKKTSHTEEVSAEYRITFPYDVSLPSDSKVFVFGNANFGVYPDDGGNPNKEKFINSVNNYNIEIIVPSNWSRNGFIRSGISQENVHVISHGVWTSIFKPMTIKSKLDLRRKYGLKEDDFVVLNLGAMTSNKGIDLLLAAAWHLRNAIPNMRLILKDASSLYNLSIRNTLAGFNSDDRDKLARDLSDRIITISDVLTIEKMSDLYNIADIYVSPYRAEGFNLPPLEAASCGIPVIVTDGGPTDDYFNDIMGYKIESQVVNMNDGGLMLEPKLDSLIENIKLAYQKRNQFDAQLISRYVHDNFDWHIIAKSLLHLLDTSPKD